MDQNNANHLETIFFAALEIHDPEARASYLSETCGQDAELRQRVEQMLAIQSKVGSFMENPPVAFDATIDLDKKILDAGLTAGLREDQAVVIGSANHSVLKSLIRTLNEMPRVMLRDPNEVGIDPIVRPRSKEIPADHADSRYQLAGEIARGGMGAIIKGRDIDLGRDLAIKVLLDSHKDKPEVVQRFIEEAQIGGQLQHPGIVPVYELGQFGDQRPFFSMKLVKGQTLAQVLAARKHPSEDRAKYLGIFEQICQTMAYAHSRGVIHRDLKPANIMVGAFGEVQVMDWGLAKVLAVGGIADEKKSLEKQTEVSIIRTLRSVGSDSPGSTGSQTQMGSVMGTPAYMSPEQALGEVDRLDERTDVFGLGAILCEILTGKPPYVASSGEQVFRLASRGKLEDCYARLDDCEVDAELLQIVRDALALEPDERLRDAGELSKRVSEYLQSVDNRLRQAELERHQAVTRSEETRKRQTVVSALAASLLVGVIASTWFALRASEQQKLAEVARLTAVDERNRAEKSQQAEIVQREKAEAAGTSEAAQRIAAEQERDRATALNEQLQQQQEQQRRMLYTSEMNLVQTAWEKQQYDRVDQLLDQQLPIAGQSDLRGFEWHYWHRQLNTGRLRTLQIPLLDLGRSSLAFSRDRTRFASMIGTQPGLLTVRDMPGGRQILAPINPFPEHQGYVRDQLLSMNGDGSRVAVALSYVGGGGPERNNPISIRDGMTGNELCRIDNSGVVSAIAMSPEGDRLAVAYGQMIIGERNTESLVKIWNTSTGDLQQTLPPVTKTSGREIVLWSPTGTQLVWYTNWSERAFNGKKGLFHERLQCVDAASGKELWQRESSGPVASLRVWGWSPDGRIMVVAQASSPDSGAKPNLQLWDSVSGQPRAILVRPAAALTDDSTIDFSPDGRQLAVGSTAHEIYVWDISQLRLDSGAEPVRVGAPHVILRTIGEEAYGLRFSADGRVLYSVGASSVVTWDPRVKGNTAGPESRLSWASSSATISSDATKVAISDITTGVIVWELSSDQELCRLSASPRRAVNTSRRVSQNYAPGPPAFSFDGRLLACLIDLWTAYPTRQIIPRQIIICDAETGQLQKSILMDQDDKSRAFLLGPPEFRPDGKQIAVVDKSSGETQRPGRLIAWNTTSGERDLSVSLDAGEAWLCGYSTDGSSLVVGLRNQQECSALFFDPMTGARQKSVSLPGSQASFRINVRDNLMGRNEGLDYILYDLATGREHLRLRGQGHVDQFSISPDGSRIALGGLLDNSSRENEISLWCQTTGRRLLTLRHQGKIQALTFSPDGHRLMATFTELSSDKPIKIWDASHLTPHVVEAEKIVEFLTNPRGADALPLASEILARIDADQTLSDDARTVAVTLIKGLHREKELQLAAWAIAKVPEQPRVKYERALHYLEEAAATETDNGESWTTRGLVHYRLGQSTEALAAIAHSQELHAKHKLALQAEDLTILAMTQQQSGKTDEARATLKQVRSSASRKESELQDLLAEAESLLHVPKASETPELWIGRRVMPRLDARVENENGKVINPFVPYTIQSVKGDELHFEASQGVLGAASIPRSRVVLLENAGSYYTKLMQATLESAPDYNRRGIVWMVTGEFDKAIEDYTAAIQLSPTFYAPLQNRGKVWLLYKHDFAKALADFDEALRLDANNAILHMFRGIARTKQGELDDALMSFDEAIRLTPELGSAYTWRAYAWSAKGDRAKMLSDLEEGTRRSPEVTDTWSEGAWLLATSPNAEQRDGKRAVADATKACELTFWNEFRCLDVLAAAYAETGDFEQAVKWQEKVVALLPPSQRADFELRLKLYREGKPFREQPKAKVIA